MSADPDVTPPVLVLGLGNLLLRDDGVGLAILEALQESALQGEALPGVEYVDGGTQGIALCGQLTGRRAVLVLDAVRFGAAPGTVHRIDDPLTQRPPRAEGAHEANAGDLLAASALLGDLPESVVVLGVEPGVVRTGIGLSEPVQGALPAAVAAAQKVVAELAAHAR